MNMKFLKLTAVFIALLSGSLAFSQTATSYMLYLPKGFIEDAKTIKVNNFKSTSDKESKSSTGLQIKTTLKSLINSETRGGYASSIYNKWMKTNLFKTVDEGTNSDIVIDGSYTLVKKENNYKKENVYHTNHATNLPIPYVIVSYQGENVVSLEVTAELKKADGTAITNYTVKSSKNNKTKESWGIPGSKLKPIGGLINTCIADAGWQIGNMFLPGLIRKNYEIKKVKLKDKAKKKQAKQAKKDFKDKKYKESGKIYKELADGGCNEAAFNAAIVYELIGNYTKAKEYYEKSGNTSNSQVLDKYLTIMELLKKAGKTVEEPEL